MYQKIMVPIIGKFLFSKLRVHGVFTIICKEPDGKIKWIAKAPNLIVNGGLNHTLNVVLGADAKTAAWYVGLKNAGTPAAGDTLATHPSWTENNNYTGDRKAFTTAPSTAQSISNAASKATFAINTNGQNIAGALLADAATGTTGLLFSAADFSSAKAADNGDTLEVQYTVNASN